MIIESPIHRQHVLRLSPDLTKICKSRIEQHPSSKPYSWRHFVLLSSRKFFNCFAIGSLSICCMCLKTKVALIPIIDGEHRTFVRADVPQFIAFPGKTPPQVLQKGRYRSLKTSFLDSPLRVGHFVSNPDRARGRPRISRAGGSSSPWTFAWKTWADLPMRGPYKAGLNASKA